MHEYSKYLLQQGSVTCPRSAYPVPVEKCYRCRYFRDQQETLRGDDVICCDFIEVEVELSRRILD